MDKHHSAAQSRSHGIPNHRKNALLDLDGQRWPRVDDGGQIGVERGVCCADCTGKCSAFRIKPPFSRENVRFFESRRGHYVSFENVSLASENKLASLGCLLERLSQQRAKLRE